MKETNSDFKKRRETKKEKMRRDKVWKGRKMKKMKQGR